MDVNELVQTEFSGLSPLVIGGVVGECERIVVRARTPQGFSVCPVVGFVGTRARLSLTDSGRRAGR
ncbi:hypothetical protein ACFCXR_11040 [Streptomyces noursei]|uniref:hypothetical protein n=1 Tax=Streptomyces TaxID=1883 RepID=UPI0035D5DD71